MQLYSYATDFYLKFISEKTHVLITLVRCELVLDEAINMCTVLYCIDGVVIAAKCTATFSRYIVLLGREYAD